MKRLCFSVAFTLVVGVALSAQSVSPSPAAPQTGPDLSGRWTRDAASSSADSAGSPGWGPQVEIKQSGADVTAQPPSGKPQRFSLDGKETAELAAIEGCFAVTRVTKSQIDAGRVTITTWLVRRGSAKCIHGTVDCEALEKLMAEMPMDHRGPRKLESITVVSRDGDTMTVDTTRSNPGGTPTSTTTTYRK